MTESRWCGVFGEYPIPDRFWGTRIRKDGWPDQRFTKGKAMVEYFFALENDMSNRLNRVERVFGKNRVHEMNA